MVTAVKREAQPVDEFLQGLWDWQKQTLKPNKMTEAALNGKATRDQLKAWARERFYAHWWGQQEIAALISIMPDWDTYLTFAENFSREAGFYQTPNHTLLYVDFCKAMGLTLEELAGYMPMPETVGAFYTRSYFRRSTPEEAIAAFSLASEGRRRAKGGAIFQDKASDRLKRHYGLQDKDVMFWKVHEMAEDDDIASGEAAIARLLQTPEQQERARRSFVFCTLTSQAMYQAMDRFLEPGFKYQPSPVALFADKVKPPAQFLDELWSWQKTVVKRPKIWDAIIKGTASKEAVKRFALEGFYAHHWGQHELAALVARAPDWQTYMAYAENFSREAGFYQTPNHTLLYIDFCKALGLSEDELLGHTPLPSTISAFYTRSYFRRATFEEAIAAFSLASEGRKRVPQERKDAMRRSQVFKQNYGLDDKAVAFYRVHEEVEDADIATGMSVVERFCQTLDQQNRVRRAFMFCTLTSQRMFDAQDQFLKEG